MKNILLFWAFMGQSLLLQAQACINFTYDAAGMRVSRYSCASRPAPTTDRAATAVVTDTLGEEQAKPASLHIVPNPTQGHFVVSVEGYSPAAEIGIWNEDGHLLFARPLGDGAIDLTSYPAGRYFVRLTEKNTRMAAIVLKTNN